MKILVFTEGTIIMHRNARGVSREEAVRQSKQAGIQREERTLSHNMKRSFKAKSLEGDNLSKITAGFFQIIYQVNKPADYKYPQEKSQRICPDIRNDSCLFC